MLDNNAGTCFQRGRPYSAAFGTARRPVFKISGQSHSLAAGAAAFLGRPGCTDRSVSVLPWISVAAAQTAGAGHPALQGPRRRHGASRNRGQSQRALYTGFTAPRSGLLLLSGGGSAARRAHHSG